MKRLFFLLVFIAIFTSCTNICPDAQNRIATETKMVQTYIDDFLLPLPTTYCPRHGCQIIVDSEPHIQFVRVDSTTGEPHFSVSLNWYCPHRGLLNSFSEFISKKSVYNLVIITDNNSSYLYLNTSTIFTLEELKAKELQWQ